MNRRTFLARSLWAGAGSTAGAACRGSATQQPAPATRQGRSLQDMADAVLACSSDEIAELALGFAADGATHRDLLGAAYLAGLREINPSPIGGQVHALMMVASAAETSAVLRGRRKLLPALFNLQRVKRSQARDAGSPGGDWVMKPAPAVAPGPVAEHDAALAAAMDSWDEQAGDAAVVALHDALPIDAFFERLWPWAARDFRVIGHKIIFAVQSYRALQEIGWRHGRDAVRSVALGVLDANPFDSYSTEESKRILALFDHNRVRAARVPADWLVREPDPEVSFELLARFREIDAEAAADAVVGALQAGASAASVWDGVRLYAFELTMQHPSIAGVHTVTSVNALHRAARITNVEATRRLCILQAASWLPLFRPLLRDRVQSPRQIRIDALAAGTRAKAAADPFATADFEEGARRAATLVAGGGLSRFTARTLDVLAEKAQHDHDYKYSVAAVEEVGAAHAACQPLLASAAMGMLRNDTSEPSAALRALR